MALTWSVHAQKQPPVDPHQTSDDAIARRRIDPPDNFLGPFLSVMIGWASRRLRSVRRSSSP
jgi:hypothetical protein